MQQYITKKSKQNNSRGPSPWQRGCHLLGPLNLLGLSIRVPGSARVSLREPARLWKSLPSWRGRKRRSETPGSQSGKSGGKVPRKV